MKINLCEIFLKLAQPNEKGESREVYKYEFKNEYKMLHFTNGCNWMRSLKGKYIYKTYGRGNDWYIKLVGFDHDNSNRSVSRKIKNELKKNLCVHTGFRGTTQNPIEIDHKNGRYSDFNVLNIKTQKLENFQALCRQANLQKRSFCKKCKSSNFRFDAKILGYKKSVISGTLKYDEKNGCEGCYWFDPLKFKNNL